jgi:hypothetical protein
LSLPVIFCSFLRSGLVILPAATRSAIECDSFDLVVESSLVTMVET